MGASPIFSKRYKAACAAREAVRVEAKQVFDTQVAKITAQWSADHKANYAWFDKARPEMWARANASIERARLVMRQSLDSGKCSIDEAQHIHRCEVERIVHKKDKLGAELQKELDMRNDRIEFVRENAMKRAAAEFGTAHDKTALEVFNSIAGQNILKWATSDWGPIKRRREYKNALNEWQIKRDEFDKEYSVVLLHDGKQHDKLISIARQIVEWEDLRPDKPE
jgi:hypothetical protein